MYSSLEIGKFINNGNLSMNRWLQFFFGTPGRAVFWGLVGIVMITFPTLIFLSVARPGLILTVLENFREEMQPLAILLIQFGVIIFALYLLIKKVRSNR